MTALLALVTAWILTLAPTERVTPPEDLAPAIVAASFAHPLPGDDGEARMAAVLVAIAWRESRFSPGAVGDHGASIGAWQISRHWHPGATVADHADRAAELVQESWRVCRARPASERLGWYASGGAGCDGLGASRGRMALAMRLFRSATAP